MTEYRLVRSQRKNLAIHITRDAIIEVRAPLKLPLSEIERFLEEKRNWIEKTASCASIMADLRARFTLEHDSKLLYRGKEYPINAQNSFRSGFDSETFFFPKNLSHDEIKAEAIRLYGELAIYHFVKRTEYFATLMKLPPVVVSVNSAKTRWGSCSSRGRIRYSWRLILAPDSVIDYVVVHELAHLKEMNHSSRFWNVVESVLPDYKLRRKGLSELQDRLSCEGWD